MEYFTTGIKELDIFLGEMPPATTLLIEGHPGSGKTILASTICYANAARGNKCLYISLQESKNKLYSSMRKLGMDFKELEEKGLLRFIHIPMSRSLEDITDLLTRAICEYSPSVIVVDSITALLYLVDEPSRRAWLQNYFYRAAEIINGLMILIAETPYERDTCELGAIEFVADVVLFLRQKIGGPLMFRTMEIRKARGAQLRTVTAPFAIIDGVGIRLYVPPVVPEIPYEKGEIKVPCGQIVKYIPGLNDKLPRGSIIYVSYPADLRLIEILAFAMTMASFNNTKLLIISFRISPYSMKHTLLTYMMKLGYEKDIAEKILDKTVEFVSINSHYYPMPELYATIAYYVENTKAEIIVFHAIDLVYLSIKDEFPWLLNNVINHLKATEKTTIFMGVPISNYMDNIVARLSDIVIKVFIEEDKGITTKARIWVRGNAPVLVTPDMVNEEIVANCFREHVNP
ncbi:MAG: ATPase domain-containing protein [Desulfurococcaceae archaeon]